MSYQQFGPVDRDERIELAADEPVGAESARWSIVPRPLLTVLVMAGFAGALYFAYVQGTHHAAPTAAATPAAPTATAPQTQQQAAAVPADNIPLIRADQQPMKVKPDQPGGMVVPDRDKLIYSERPGGPPVERLLPPAEQPAPRPLPPPPPAAAPLPLAAPPQVAAVPPSPVAKPTAAPATHTAPPPAASAPAVDRGGHIRVAIASLRTPEEARSEWQRLKHANHDLLGKLNADAVRADLGERGVWYRIEAGSFAKAATAEHLCHELKARHLGCSIVR